MFTLDNLDSMMTGPQLYRGAGVDVAHLDNDVQAIREAAGLNWEPRKLPLIAPMGEGQVQAIPRQALWRDDTDQPEGFLDVCTSSYVPHTNEAILTTMTGFCESIGVPLEKVGSYGNGARLWASADARIKQEPKKGDIVALRFLIRSGHEVGISTSVSLQAVRLVCMNGMTVNAGGRTLRFTHSTKFGHDRQRLATTFLSTAADLFDEHIEKMSALYETPMTPTIRRLVLLNLFGGTEAWEDLFERLRLERRADLKMGAETLEAILAADELKRIPWQDLAGRSRLLYEIADATRIQPGRELAEGTMAELYNGVTFFNSHRRGNGETAQEASIYGASAKNSADTLSAMLEMVPVVQEVMGTVGARR